MRAAKGHRCLGHLELSPEGRLDGWCWLPDRPDERAVIDIVVDGEPVQSEVATRLRPDLRDLGMGDGYCGFQVPLLARGRVAARVVEARERSIGFVFGRVLLPAVPAADPGLHRLNAVSKRLAAAASSLWLAGQRVDASPAEPFGLLGQAMLHRRVAPRIAASADLANGPRGASPATLESPRAVVLAACHHAIGRLPSADLGHAPQPRTSVLVYAAAPIEVLATTLRQAAASLAGLSAEFLLLDNGHTPLATLLPTRLRGLRLIRKDTLMGEGAFLNAGLCAARGDWLVVVSDPARLNARALAGLLWTASADTVHLGGAPARLLRDAVAPHVPGEQPRWGAPTGAPVQAPMEAPAEASLQSPVETCDLDAEDDLPGVVCVLPRDRFHQIGGFRERASDQAAEVWVDFVARALALGLRLRLYRSCRPFREL